MTISKIKVYHLPKTEGRFILVLSEISIQIIGFIALWIKEAESIKVMDWIKLHGRSQTLLKKIQTVSEKNL